LRYFPFFSLISYMTMLAQAPNEIKTVSVSLDANQLPSGYMVKYQIQGKVIPMQSTEINTILPPESITENITSKETHQGKLGGDNNILSSSHVLTFEIPKTHNNHGSFALSFPINYSIYDDNGALVRSSNIVLHSFNKHTRIVFKEAGRSLNGKSNIRVFVDDPSINLTNLKAVPKR